MRLRPVLAAAALLVVAVPRTAAGNAEVAADPLAVYEVRAEAGGAHSSVAVPAYFEAFHPYSLSEASNGSSHSYQTLGYPGFFLRAAGEQYGMPPPPGTTETLWPQGPTEGRAEAVPFDGAAMGETSARSFETGATGTATSGGGSMGGRRMGYGAAHTSVMAAGAASAEARVTMRDLDLGDGLTIGEVRGVATARATGTAGGASAAGTVEMVDLRFQGVELKLTAEGVRVNQTTIPLPQSGAADAALAQIGVEVRRLPDVTRVAEDGTAGSIEIGGFEIRFSRPEREFTQTFTVGRLSASTRAIRAGAPAAPEIVAQPVVGGGRAAPIIATDPVAVSTAAARARPVAPTAAVEPVSVTTAHTRRPGATWDLVALLIALGVPLFLVSRRGLAAASAP